MRQKKEKRTNEIYFCINFMSTGINGFCSWIVETLRNPTISNNSIRLSTGSCSCTTSIDPKNVCRASKSLLSMDSLLYFTTSKTTKICFVSKAAYNLRSNNTMGPSTILFILKINGFYIA